MQLKRLFWVVVGFLGITILVICITKVFSGAWVLPQYFSVGPLVIHYYGIVMALAVLGGYSLALHRSAAYKIPKQVAEQLIFWVIVGGFIGARAYHVASSWQYYLQHPVDIIKVWNGGLGIFGALVGGLITAVIVYHLSLRANASQRSNLNFKDEIATSSSTGDTKNWTPRNDIGLLKLLDWGAPSFVLGQIIGRFGNLFNYEAFGYPTNLPWKMFVPNEFRPLDSLGAAFYHPLFLYEAVGNIVILVLLLGLDYKWDKKGRTGAIFFTYLFLYTILRFLLEFLRTDSTWIWGVRLNSIVSGGLVIVGLIGLVVVKYFSQSREYTNRK